MNRELKNIVFLSVNLLAFLLIGSSNLMAQKVFQPKQVNINNKGILYKNETTFDFNVHTNGLSIAANFGKIQTYYRTKYFHIELGYLKDPRERRQNRNFVFRGVGASSDFIYGKQNSMWVLRGGLGYKHYWTEKSRNRGVAIAYNWEIGPSIALLRPYYLRLFYKEGVNDVVRTEKYSEENAEVFLEKNDIHGGAGFFEHFNEWSVTPGIQGKLGLHLSLGAYEEYAKSMEVGIMFDVYAKKIPLMVETEEISNKAYFVNFYVNIQLGYRSNN